MRLIIILVGIVLAIVTAGLLALGLIPLILAILPYTAVLGGLVALEVFISIVSINTCSGCNCALCLALLAFVPAVALLVLSIIGIAIGVGTTGTLATIFFFLLAFAFWTMVIALIAYVRCLTFRPRAG